MESSKKSPHIEGELLFLEYLTNTFISSISLYLHEIQADPSQFEYRSLIFSENAENNDELSSSNERKSTFKYKHASTNNKILQTPDLEAFKKLKNLNKELNSLYSILSEIIIRKSYKERGESFKMQLRLIGLISVLLPNLFSDKGFTSGAPMDINYVLFNAHELVDFVWTNSDFQTEEDVSSVKSFWYLFLIEIQTFTALHKSRFPSATANSKRGRDSLAREPQNRLTPQSKKQKLSSDFLRNSENKAHSNGNNTAIEEVSHLSIIQDILSDTIVSFELFSPQCHYRNESRTFWLPSKELDAYDEILKTRFESLNAKLGTSDLSSFSTWADSEYSFQTTIYLISMICKSLIDLLPKPRILEYVNTKPSSLLTEMLLEFPDSKLLFSSPTLESKHSFPESGSPPEKSNSNTNLTKSPLQKTFGSNKYAADVSFEDSLPPILADHAANVTNSPPKNCFNGQLLSTPPSQTGTSASQKVISSTKYVQNSLAGDVTGGGRLHRHRDLDFSSPDDPQYSPLLLTTQKARNSKNTSDLTPPHFNFFSTDDIDTPNQFSKPSYGLKEKHFQDVEDEFFGKPQLPDNNNNSISPKK